MRTAFIFPYGTMIKWVTIFKSKKESLYSFNYDFEHTFFITSSTSIGEFSKVTSGKHLGYNYVNIILAEYHSPFTSSR